MKLKLRHILLAAGLILGGRASAQVYAEQVLAIGRNVLAMDDYVLAIRYFNQAASAKPYLWDPYYYRALAKLMLDDFHGAEQDASKAVELNKFKYEGYRVRGFARLRLGLDSAAVADFDRGLSYAPADKYFLYYKGIAQASMKQYERADSTLDELLSLYPRFEEGYSTRAQAHLMAGDTVGALGDIDRALRINGNMTAPRLMSADIALRQSRWEDAALQLDSVINLLPTDVSLYINRAYARYNADDWPGAMADYNYALDLEPANYAALYNRALLRYQVQDLRGAKADFSAVLEQNPDDFPARYNRGLINLDLGEFRTALADFRLIAGRYPRFYPVYYAISRAEQGLGNNKAAADNFFKANDMITRYTSDPTHYKLDRPTIQSGSTREQSTEKDLTASSEPEDVMEHFNELVTISQTEQSTPLYGEKLKGRVQDVEMRVQPEGAFALTIFDPTDELRPRSETYAELTDINSSRWLSEPLYLVSGSTTPQDAARIDELFALTQRLDAREQQAGLRPIDRLERAVANTALKNYEGAMEDLDKALEANPQFVSALLQRAYVRPLLEKAEQISGAETSGAEGRMLAEAAEREALQQAMADYDAALRIDPRLAHAWMGKGCLLYQGGDWQGADECFSQAVALRPDMGQALFNRALSRLRMGRKREAMSDLSRAGELGVVQAYNLLKKI